MIESREEHKAGRRRLLDNIASLYLLQGLNYVIPMAVLPYLVRVLGMEVYGLVAFSQAFAQYFTILTDYGFNLSATRFVAQHRSDQSAVRQMFWQVLILKAALMILGLVLLLVIVATIPRFQHDGAYLSVAFIAVVGNVIFPQWYFQGIEKMRYISICTGIARIISAALLFVFVHGPGDGLLALIIQSGGTLIAGFMGIISAFHVIGLQVEFPTLASLRKTVYAGWHLFISTAAVSLYSNTNMFLVGLLAGNVEAGYFSAAEKLIRAMSGLIGPITQAIFPHINSLAHRSREVALRLISKSLCWMVAVTLVSSLGMLALAKPIAILCFGVAAFGSVPIIRWIAPLPLLIAISNVLGIQTMLTFGLDRQFSRILLASGILNVVIGVPLIHFFAAQGAGAAVLITEMTVAVTMIVVLQKHGIHVLFPRSIAL